MKNYLFFSTMAMIACNIFAADFSLTPLSGQEISRKVEANDFVTFDEKTCPFSPQEIRELDEVIESIGKKDRYKNGDNGATHENAHYGIIAMMLVNSETDDGLTGHFIEENPNWISFEDTYAQSYLEEEIYTKPIIETLFRRIASALRAPPPGAGYIIKLKLVCSHEENHIPLRKHQDGTNYLFTLITNVQDIEGGEMFIYRLNEPGRTSLQENTYYVGDNVKELFKSPARAGIGYVIKERPDDRKEEPVCCPIVHGHTLWTKKGEHPTRNVVIVRVYYFSAKKIESGTYATGQKFYRND